MEKYNWYGFIRKEYRLLYQQCIDDEDFAEVNKYRLRMEDYSNIILHHALSKLKPKENEN